MTRHLSVIMILMVSLLTTGKGWLYANPVKDKVIKGKVSIREMENEMLIYASDKSIIQYKSFNIDADETVRFVQPFENARVLNRIQSEDPSVIAGRLLSNGNVYIVNPAGVYFNNGSVVDAAGLYVAAGAISNRDFINGQDQFTELTGSVINDGNIYAETVALVGNYIENNGLIRANEGVIVLAAGDNVYLTRRNSNIMVQISGILESRGDSAALVNRGELNATSGQVSLISGDMYALALGIHQQGKIVADQVTVAAGDKGVVKVSGHIDVANEETAGNIEITGERIALFGASLNVSGAIGGSIKIGGDYQGRGDTRRSEVTLVDNDTSIRADGGGQVILWSDKFTQFEGNIFARGNPEGGDGGFVEISGLENMLFKGSVDTTADAGQAGLLLLDPLNITISDTVNTGDGWLTDDNQILITENFANSITIWEDTLQGIVGTTNILLEARQHITLEDLTDDTLSLAAQGGFTVTFHCDQNMSGDSDGDFTMNSGDTITTNGGNLTIIGDDVSIGTILSSGGNITVQADELTLNTAINAGAGSVLIAPRRSMHMDIGAGTTGLDISDTELSRITTSGTLTLGDITNTSSMDVESVTDHAGISGTMQFISGGDIEFVNGGDSTISTPLAQFFATNGITNAASLQFGKNVTFNADYDDDGGGDFTNQTGADTVDTSGANASITITAADIALAGSLNSGAGNVTIYPSNNRSMGINTGNMSLTDTELDNIISTGTVTLDTSSTFVIAQSATFTGNLSIIAGDNVSQSQPVDITGNLSVTTDVNNKSITLANAANAVSGSVNLTTQGGSGECFLAGK